MRISLYALLALALLLLLPAAFPYAAAQEAWMQKVGLPLDGYSGRNVLVVIVSTGININHPELKDRILEVDGVPCAVAFDSQGVMYTPSGITTTSIGTTEALEVVKVAPRVKIAVVEVPYVKDARGLPTVPPAALRAALEWLLNPVVNSTTGLVKCDFAQFSSVIVLLGLPIYSNYTLDPGTANLLEKITARYLVVTPVGDVAPGVMNVLAKKIGVISVGWVPLAGEVTPNGHSGGFWLEKPHGEYRDLPLAPSYSIPVNPLSCSIGYTVESVTCSEVAAARFAGLAAVLAEAYYDLVGAPPLPYQLEQLIRASVHDYGLPLKDSLYGWGVPDAQVAYKLLSSNSGFRICAPDYARDTPALVSLEAPEGLRYGLVLYPGECVKVRALPSTPYTIRVYGPPTLDPGYTVSITAAGYYRKVVIVPRLSSTLEVTGSVVDEKGVALGGEALILPGDLTQVNAIIVNTLLHPLYFEHGELNLVLSWPYLKSLSAETYILIKPRGYLAKLYKLPASPGTLNLGTQVFVEAPSVYLVGKGPGAEETADILRLMGFNVTTGYSPIPPPDASVIVVHPSAAPLAWQVQSTGRGVVLLGAAAEAARRAISWTVATPSTILTGSAAYIPGYQPLLSSPNLRLETLYGYSASVGSVYTITLYNITLVPSEAPFVELYSYTSGANGKVVEVAFDPRTRVAYVANLWSYWGTRIGPEEVSPRSLLASGSPIAFAVLQLAVEAAAHPVWISVDKRVVRTGDKLGVSVWGWRLQVTLWMETVHGLEKVTTVKAPYPNYYANVTLKVPLEPYGSYKLLANDSLWGLAVARYSVVPYLNATPRIVYAGGYVRLSGTGYPANTTLQVLFDGVAIYSTLTNPLGSFTSIVRVPSVAEPGKHMISVVVSGIGASVEIIVKVHKALEVKVSAPPLLLPNMSGEGSIVVTLGGRRVNANVTVYVSGYTIKPQRIAKGLYLFVVPHLPPGSYTLLVEAEYNSSLVEAYGVAVAPIAVIQVPSAPEILYYVDKLLARYYTLYNESVTRIEKSLSKNGEKLETLYNTILALNKTFTQLSGKIDERTETVLRRISSLASLIGNSVERLALRASVIESELKKLEEKMPASIANSVNKALGGLEARVSTISVEVARGLTEVRMSIGNLAKSLSSKLPDTTLFYLLVALLIANLGVSAASLVLSRRR